MNLREAMIASLEDHDIEGSPIYLGAGDTLWVSTLADIEQWVRKLLAAHPESDERHWWVTQHRYARKVLGPFASSEEAIKNREQIERLTERSDFWIWDDRDVKPASQRFGGVA